MTLLFNIFFNKKTFQRVFTDLPLIYFATVSATITSYVTSEDSFEWANIFLILLSTLAVLLVLFVIYYAIYRFIRE